MNSIPALFACIEAQEHRFQNFLARLTAQESFSLDRESVSLAAELTAAFAKELGFSVEEHPFPRAGSGLVVSRETGSVSAPIGFVAHLDTVHPAGSFPDSLKPAPEGGLYGPGIVDCKGGVAVALLAMYALKELGFSRPLRLLLTPDEEVSNRLTGDDGIAFLQSHVKDCAAAFVCECGKRDEALVERKGITKVRVDIRACRYVLRRGHQRRSGGGLSDSGAGGAEPSRRRHLQLRPHQRRHGGKRRPRDLLVYC